MKSILADMFVIHLGLFLILAQCATEIGTTDVTVESQPRDRMQKHGGYFEFGIDGKVKRQDAGSLADLGPTLPSDSCTYIVGHFEGIDAMILIVWVPAGASANERRAYKDKVDTFKSGLEISAAIVAEDGSDLAEDTVKREVQLLVLQNAPRQEILSKRRRGWWWGR